MIFREHRKRFEAATPEERIRHLWVVWFVGTSMVVLGFITAEFWEGYQEHTEFLGFIVESDIRIFHAVHEFDAMESGDFPGGSHAATLHQFREAYAGQRAFNETGEIVLCSIDGNEVVIYGRNDETRIQIGSELEVAAQRALLGESGTVVTNDYEGTRVIAAYAPIDGTDFALVAKQDFSEVLALEVLAIAPASILALIILFLLTRYFSMSLVRIVGVLRRDTERFARSERIGNFAYWACSLDDDLMTVSHHMKNLLPTLVQDGKLSRSRYFESIHPDDLEKVRTAFTSALETSDEVDLIHRVTELPGSEIKYLRLQTSFRPGIVTERKNVEGMLQDVTDSVMRQIEFNVSTSLLRERLLQQECLREIRDLLDIMVDFELTFPAVSETFKVGLVVFPHITSGFFLDGQFYAECTFDRCVIHERIAITLGGLERGYIELCADEEHDPDSWNTVYVYADSVASLIEEALSRENSQREKNLLQMALNSTVDGVLITDDSGRIQWANPGIEKITGYTSKQLCQTTPRALKSGIHSREFYEEMWSTITSGESWSGEVVNRKKSGELYRARLSITPITDSDGVVLNFIGVQSDVTKEREIEKQLRQAQKLEALGTLVGGISHDFNNLLSSILGYADLAQAELIQGSQPYQDLDEVINAGHRAKSLIRQILTFSRGRETEEVLLQPRLIVNEALKLLEQTIPQSIQLNAHLDKFESMVNMDPTQLHQIVMNLVTNAYHAIPHDKGTINVTLVETRISEPVAGVTTTIAPGKYIRLCVEDDGTGIDTDLLTRIFDPFFTTKPVDKGTGLGLSTVLGIVEQSNGTVTVKSEVGKGTLFYVYIPVAELVRDSGPEIKAEVSKGAGECIMIVDDREEVCDVHSRILSSLGYTVVTYVDPGEALAAFTQNPKICDAILTDYTMPRLSGVELARQAWAIRPDLPVIISSGRNDIPEYHELKDDCRIEFVRKPIDRELLSIKIANLLEKT